VWPPLRGEPKRGGVGALRKSVFPSLPAHKEERAVEKGETAYAALAMDAKDCNGKGRVASSEAIALKGGGGRGTRIWGVSKPSKEKNNNVD